MKKLKTNSTRNIFGFITVIAGILIFLAGIFLRRWFPGTVADTRLLEGLGLLLIGWSIVPLARSIKAMRDPLGARRESLAENDERAIAIRNQAGFAAFVFSTAASTLTLIIYSAFTRGNPGIDPVWLALIVLSVVPVIIFSLMFCLLNRR